MLAAVEHSAVRQWAERGDARSWSASTARGRIDPDELMARRGRPTALVHVQWANHEVGTIQPVAEVVARLPGRGVLVHVDAARPRATCRSTSSASAPTCCRSPATSSADRPAPARCWSDGACGSGRCWSAATRSGPAEPASRTWSERSASAPPRARPWRSLAGRGGPVGTLTDRVLAWAGATEGIGVFGDPDHRLPHLVCLGIDGVEPQAVLLGLDQAGIAVHSGSSCTSESLEPSPVLEAMGVDAHRSLRVSVGWNTTDADIDLLLEALPEVLGRLSALRTG